MKKFLFIFLIFFIIFSCKKRAESIKEYPVEKAEYEQIGGNQKKLLQVKDKMPNVVDADKAQSNNNFLNNRKIIKRGSITYQVKELESIEDTVKDKVEEFGGYISNSVYNENRLSMSIKIPVERFEDFLKEANNFGKVLNKSVSADDVTKQYFDLEGRIKNKRIHQKRIRDYIEYAKNIDDLIKYENELNRVTNELESLEANFKNLSHEIAFSSLNMEFTVPYAKKISRKWPSIKNAFDNFCYFIVIFLFNLIRIIIYIIIISFFIIIVSIPVILMLGGVYYISFGKLGLLKKLFKNLSEGKKK
jgi:hypothetical protein